MNFFRKLKDFFKRDNKIDFQNEDYKKSKLKSLENSNLASKREGYREIFNFENFKNLRKRPIINNVSEREELHNLISKELEKLG
jgi:hypothetical protein